MLFTVGVRLVVGRGLLGAFWVGRGSVFAFYGPVMFEIKDNVVFFCVFFGDVRFEDDYF